MDAPTGRIRRRRRLATAASITALGLGLGVTGCGGGDETASTAASPATTVSTGATTAPSADAATAVSSAYAKLRMSSYVSTATGTQDIDASGLDESLRSGIESQLTAQATNISATTRFESPERVAISQDLGLTDQEIVLYDGSIYVSPDGTTWAKATGDAAAAFSQASTIAKIDAASLYSGLHETGTGEVNGSPATRYEGAIDSAKATALTSAVTGALGALGEAVGKAITIGDGTATILVDDATGTVAQQRVALSISLDIGAIAGAAGESGAADVGSISVRTTTVETITDVGGDVVVKEPDATETVSSVIELGQFLTRG